MVESRLSQDVYIDFGFIFLVILFLNRIRPRFWCRTLCPLGALLGKGIIRTLPTLWPVYESLLHQCDQPDIDRGRCLPWSGNAPCIVCQEVCPTSPKAIYLKADVVATSDKKSLNVQLPLVDLKRCVGCGNCENKCPVRGLPAIRTISAGESRSLSNQILL